MSIFSKSKPNEKKKLPNVIDHPIKAYIYRTSPQKVGKVQVGGRIPGELDGWRTTQELEDKVEQMCGGGTFECKCYQEVDGKTEYAGSHNFILPGRPIVDGVRVGKNDDEEEEKKRKQSAVDKIEEQIEEEEAQARLDEARARRKARLKEAGLMSDDDDGESTPQLPMMQQQESSEIAALKAHIEQMRMEMEREKREAERERHRQEIEAERERARRESESTRAEFQRQIEELRRDRGSTDGGAAQMNAIQAIITSGQEQVRAMLQSNSELVKTLLTRDTSAPMNERIDRLMEKLIDNKSGAGKEQMEIMREAFQTGIHMARGGEQPPTTMADVASQFGNRLMDIVGEYTRNKGSMSEDVIRQKIAEASDVVAKNVIQRIAPAVRSGLPSPQQPGAIPAASAASAAATPAASGEGEEVQRTPELTAAVDQVIEAFLEDLQSGGKTQKWMMVAREKIPADVLASIGELTFDNLSNFAFQYGSPEVVSKAIVALTKLGADTPEEHAVADQIAARAGDEARNPSVPQESSVDIFDQDVTEDDEPADPVHPQKAHPTQPAKPKKRGRPRKAQ